MPKTTATAAEELKKIYRAMEKLRNNLHRKDLDFTCQIAVNTTEPNRIVYAVSMTAPANGLAPIMFIANSSEDMLKQVKAATKHIDYDEVERAYHKAQIISCDNTKKGHEERLAELDKPEEERGTKIVEPKAYPGELSDEQKAKIVEGERQKKMQ